MLFSTLYNVRVAEQLGSHILSFSAETRNRLIGEFISLCRWFINSLAGSLGSFAVDNTIRLQGAGAFAFHPTLEWIFVGDRRGTILAWDVSTERPLMIGM